MLHFEIWRMDSIDEHDGIGFAIGQEIFEQVDQLKNFLDRGDNLSLDIDTPHHDDEVIKFIKENARLIVDMSKKMPELEEKSAEFGYGVLCPFFFCNYSWTQFRMLYRFTPTNRKQVQVMVKICKLLNIKMGAAGFRGSWSAVFPDNGGMVFDLRNLRLDNGKTITFNGDEKDPKITISPGVTEKKLKKYFLKNNLCFYSDVIVESVTYGGVVSGGSHGTGKDQKSVSDNLTELKIVNAEGEIDVYNETSNPHKLPAAKVNLGLFGIAVEYTFKVKPMACVKVDLSITKLSEVFSTPDKIKTLWDENWSLEIVVDQIKMNNMDDSRVTIRAVKDTPTPIGDRWRCPWRFMRIPFAIHFLFGTMHIIPIYVMEFCFPYKPDTVKKAMDNVTDVLKAQKSSFSSYRPRVFADVRFIQYSDTLLCPAIFKEHSFYLQVILPRNRFSIPVCQHFYKAIAEKWYKLGGIPHWHKDWDYLPGIDDQIKKVYGWRIQKFEEIRKEVDPGELFLNERMKKLFQE